MNFIDIVKMLL